LDVFDGFVEFLKLFNVVFGQLLVHYELLLALGLGIWRVGSKLLLMVRKIIAAVKVEFLLVLLGRVCLGIFLFVTLRFFN
jgi:hypothetical protein